MNDQLYELLQAAKTDAPPLRYSVDDIVAKGRRRRVLRRARAVGAVAALVAAAAITVPHVATGHGGVVPAVQTPGPGYPTAPFSYGWTGYTVGRFQVDPPNLVTPGYQESYIRKDGELSSIDAPSKDGGSTTVVASVPGYSAVLTIYRPGVFKPTRFAGAQPVQVHGRTGDFTGYFAPDLFYRDESLPPHPRSAFAWQYAPDGWAVISSLSTSYTRDDMVEISENFTRSAAYPATVAFKASWIPAGYVLAAAGLTDVYPFGGPEEVSSIRLVKALPSFRDLTQPVDFENLATPSITITLYPKAWVDSTHQNPAPAVCNAVNPTFCYRMTPDGNYGLDAVRIGDVPDSDLTKILDTLTFAQEGNPSTWFPATGAAQSAVH